MLLPLYLIANLYLIQTCALDTYPGGLYPGGLYPGFAGIPTLAPNPTPALVVGLALGLVRTTTLTLTLTLTLQYTGLRMVKGEHILLLCYTYNPSHHPYLSRGAIFVVDEVSQQLYFMVRD